MNEMDAVVARHLARLVNLEGGIANVEFDADLFADYGLSSLNMVLLITSVCNETDTPLMHFTEEDIAGLRTVRGIADLVSAVARAGVPR